VTLFYIDSPPHSSSTSITPALAETILLIHGFPETSHQFRHIITPLSNAGYRVIAPDYRGAGFSSKPRDLAGYRKSVMAGDIVSLLDVLGVDKVHVVGHDIGGMVAHSFATRYEGRTRSVMWGECPQPGTEVYGEFAGLVGWVVWWY
jgi:pimeloyl-ACP methyl ester carboxylesterase